jgi:hypothetical protein
MQVQEQLEVDELVHNMGLIEQMLHMMMLVHHDEMDEKEEIAECPLCFLQNPLLEVEL